jgi:hypothetical protein
MKSSLWRLEDISFQFFRLSPAAAAEIKLSIGDDMHAFFYAHQ